VAIGHGSRFDVVRRAALALAGVATAVVAAGCGTHDPGYPVPSGPRDWNVHPAIVQIAAPKTLYAVSDIHGMYSVLAPLLFVNGITAGIPTSPSEVRWAAADAVLVVVGDVVNKGPKSIECLEFLEALQADAEAAGGRVIVTFGNHEAEFLADPLDGNDSATSTLRGELGAQGVNPLRFGDGTDPRGLWMRNWPFAVLAGDWFFVHAGDTGLRSQATLAADLQADVDLHGYRGDETVGAASILEASGIFDKDATLGPRDADALGVRHVVFGHDPKAIGKKGVIVTASNGTLFRIDTGITPDQNYGTGEILRIRFDGDTATADVLDNKGGATPLWAGPSGTAAPP